MNRAIMTAGNVARSAVEPPVEERTSMKRAFALEPKSLRLQMAQRALMSVLTLFLWLPAYSVQYQQASAQDATGPPYTQQAPEQLQQLVAPIALYPDSL